MITQQSMQGQLRRMTENDLITVLEWRNHPDIRNFMYTQHEIKLDEHRRWFERSVRDDTRNLMIFEIDAVSLGYVNFHQNGASPVVDWGFYLAPGAPKGTGLKLGIAALNYAFKQMKMHKVCGQALGFNEKSIRFHLSLGFKQEGVLRDQYFDGENYHNVECFGILSNEWIENAYGK